uniref:Uncharacterized protein n=1 Tax=Tanacetum cinerariifolium TaxID=118510 RepID=A0A699GEU9_TANCI|nr:hypothetical protein [Tanacetum cinerariifolium]
MPWPHLPRYHVAVCGSYIVATVTAELDLAYANRRAKPQAGDAGSTGTGSGIGSTLTGRRPVSGPGCRSDQRLAPGQRRPRHPRFAVALDRQAHEGIGRRVERKEVRQHGGQQQRRRPGVVRGIECDNDVGAAAVAAPGAGLARHARRAGRGGEVRDAADLARVARRVAGEQGQHRAQGRHAGAAVDQRAVVQAQQRDQRPQRIAVQRGRALRAGLVQGADVGRPGDAVAVKARAGRDLAGELAVGAQQVGIDDGLRVRRAHVAAVDHTQVDVGTGDAGTQAGGAAHGPGQGHPACVGERAGHDGAAPFARIGDGDRDDVMHLGGGIALAVGYQQVFVVALVVRDRFAGDGKQVERRHAVQANVLGAQQRQDVGAMGERQPDAEAGPGAQLAAQAAQVEELEFAGKGKVFLQQAICRMSMGRVGQHRLAFAEAGLLQATGRQALHAGAAGDVDPGKARQQQLVQRHRRQQVASQMQAQAVHFQLGQVDAGIGHHVDAQHAGVFQRHRADLQRPQGAGPGRTEAARLARQRRGRQRSAACDVAARGDFALEGIERHLHDGHRRHRPGQVGTQVVEDGGGGLRRERIDVAVDAGGEKRDRFDQVLDVRVGRVGVAGYQAPSHFRMARGEVGGLRVEVAQFAAVVIEVGVVGGHLNLDPGVRPDDGFQAGIVTIARPGSYLSQFGPEPGIFLNGKTKIGTVDKITQLIEFTISIRHRGQVCHPNTTPASSTVKARFHPSRRLHRPQIPRPRAIALGRRIGLLLRKGRRDFGEIDRKRIVGYPATAAAAHLRNHGVCHLVLHEVHVHAIFDAADIQGGHADFGTLRAGLEQLRRRQVGWFRERHFGQHRAAHRAFGIACVATHWQIGAVGERADDDLEGERRGASASLRRIKNARGYISPPAPAIPPPGESTIEVVQLRLVHRLPAEKRRRIGSLGIDHCNEAQVVEFLLAPVGDEHFGRAFQRNVPFVGLERVRRHARDLAAAFHAANRRRPAMLGKRIGDAQAQLISRVRPQVFAVVGAVDVLFECERLHRIGLGAIRQAGGVARQDQGDVARVFRFAETAPRRQLGAVEDFAHVARHAQFGERLHVEQRRRRRRDEWRMGGGSHFRQALEQRHVLRVAAEIIVADEQRIGMTAEGAVFFLVDFFKEHAHVVVDRAFQVFQQLFFRHVQQAQFQLAARLRAHDHVVQAAPGAFQRLETFAVHDGVHLVAEDLVDLGHALVDGGDDALVRRRLHAFVEHLRGELAQQRARVGALRWLDGHLAFLDDAVQQRHVFDRRGTAAGLGRLSGSHGGSFSGGGVRKRQARPVRPLVVELVIAIEFSEQVAQLLAHFEQLGQSRYLLHDRLGMKIVEGLEVQFDLQAAVLAGQRVRHRQVQARRDLLHHFIKIVAVDVDQAARLELGRRHQRLARQVGQQAHDQRQFLLLDGATDFDVVGDLYARGTVPSHPFLQAVCHHTLTRARARLAPPRVEHGAFRFGAWLVDPSANTVESADDKRQMEPRTMQVLVALCQARGAIRHRTAVHRNHPPARLPHGGAARLRPGACGRPQELAGRLAVSRTAGLRPGPYRRVFRPRRHHAPPGGRGARPGPRTNPGRPGADAGARAQRRGQDVADPGRPAARAGAARSGVAAGAAGVHHVRPGGPGRTDAVYGAGRRPARPAVGRPMGVCRRQRGGAGRAPGTRWRGRGNGAGGTVTVPAGRALRHFSRPLRGAVQCHPHRGGGTAAVPGHAGTAGAQQRGAAGNRLPQRFLSQHCAVPAAHRQPAPGRPRRSGTTRLQRYCANDPAPGGRRPADIRRRSAYPGPARRRAVRQRCRQSRRPAPAAILPARAVPPAHGRRRTGVRGVPPAGRTGRRHRPARRTGRPRARQRPASSAAARDVAGGGVVGRRRQRQQPARALGGAARRCRAPDRDGADPVAPVRQRPGGRRARVRHRPRCDTALLAAHDGLDRRPPQRAGRARPAGAARGPLARRGQAGRPAAGARQAARRSQGAARRRNLVAHRVGMRADCRVRPPGPAARAAARAGAVDDRGAGRAGVRPGRERDAGQACGRPAPQRGRRPDGFHAGRLCRQAAPARPAGPARKRQRQGAGIPQQRGRRRPHPGRPHAARQGPADTGRSEPVARRLAAGAGRLWQGARDPAAPAGHGAARPAGAEKPGRQRLLDGADPQGPEQLDRGRGRPARLPEIRRPAAPVRSRQPGMVGGAIVCAQQLGRAGANARQAGAGGAVVCRLDCPQAARARPHARFGRRGRGAGRQLFVAGVRARVAGRAGRSAPPVRTGNAPGAAPARALSGRIDVDQPPRAGAAAPRADQPGAGLGRRRAARLRRRPPAVHGHRGAGPQQSHLAGGPGQRGAGAPAHPGPPRRHPPRRAGAATGRGAPHPAGAAGAGPEKRLVGPARSGGPHPPGRRAACRRPDPGSGARAGRGTGAPAPPAPGQPVRPEFAAGADRCAAAVGIDATTASRLATATPRMSATCSPIDKAPHDHDHQSAAHRHHFHLRHRGRRQGDVFLCIAGHRRAARQRHGLRPRMPPGVVLPVHPRLRFHPGRLDPDRHVAQRRPHRHDQRAGRPQPVAAHLRPVHLLQHLPFLPALPEHPDGRQGRDRSSGRQRAAPLSDFKRAGAVVARRRWRRPARPALSCRARPGGRTATARRCGRSAYRASALPPARGRARCGCCLPGDAAAAAPVAALPAPAGAAPAMRPAFRHAKTRHVTAQRQRDAHTVADVGAGIGTGLVSVEPRTQPAHLHPHHRVERGVVRARIAPEHLQPDRIFGDLVLPAGQLFLDQERQQVAHARRPRKRGQQLLRRMPDGVVGRRGGAGLHYQLMTSVHGRIRSSEWSAARAACRIHCMGRPSSLSYDHLTGWFALLIDRCGRCRILVRSRGWDRGRECQPHLGEVQRPFPLRDCNGRHAVADQVSHGARLVEEAVDAHQQHQPGQRYLVHRCQRGRQRHKARARHTGRTLGRQQHHAQDHDLVPQGHVHVGGLGNEDGGHGQIDGRAVGIERVAGRQHQAHHFLFATHGFHFHQHLRQHGLGGRRAQHDQDFILDDAGRVHGQHQLGKRIERADAVLGDGEGDAAERADGRQEHHVTHHAEHAMQKHVQHIDQRRHLLAQPVQRKREQQREQDDLQHIALHEGTHHAAGHDVHQELRSRVMFGCRRVGLDGRRVDGAGVDMHARAGLDHVHDDQPEHQRDGRADLEVQHGLGADASRFLDAAHAGNAHHHRGKDDRRQQHLDELDEQVAERLELDADVGIKMAHQHACREADDDLDVQRGRQVGLAFEADARQFRQHDVAVVDGHAVREAAVRLEQVRVRFVAAQAQAGRDIERHLVAAVRDAALGRPAVFAQHVERAQVFHQAVAERAVELQPVAVGPHAAVADQVAGVLHREKVFTGGHRIFIIVAQRGLQFEVERVARFLVPEQVVLRQRLGVLDSRVEVEAAVGVHGQLLAILQHAQHGIDAAQVFVEVGAADFLFHHRVAAVDVAAHLVLELVMVLARIVIPAGRVHENLAVGLAVAVAVGQQLEQRLACDLGHGIPDRHVDGADGHRALAVAARLFVGEHAVPDLVRIEVGAGVVDQAGGIGFQDARNEPLAHQRALAVAAVGVEAVADYRLAVADDVGHHGDQAQCHFAEIDVGVADGGTDRYGFFADLNDFHEASPVKHVGHGARTGRDAAGRHQAPEPDGAAAGRAPGQPYHAPHQPDQRGRVVPGAGVRHPAPDSRHGRIGVQRPRCAQGFAESERHARLRAHAHCAHRLPLCPCVPGSGSGTASDRPSHQPCGRGLRPGDPLWRAARYAPHCPQADVQSTVSMRVAGVPEKSGRAAYACRTAPAPLHPAPPERRRVRHLAPAKGQDRGTGESARRRLEQRRRHRHALGTGRPRHRPALRMGRRQVPGQRPPQGRDDRLHPARRRPLPVLPEPQQPAGQGAGVHRFYCGGIRALQFREWRGPSQQPHHRRAVRQSGHRQMAVHAAGRRIPALRAARPHCRRRHVHRRWPPHVDQRGNDRHRTGGAALRGRHYRTVALPDGVHVRRVHAGRPHQGAGDLGPERQEDRRPAHRVHQQRAVASDRGIPGFYQGTRHDVGKSGGRPSGGLGRP